MICGNEDTLIDKTKCNQIARAKLRESFLKAVQELQGKPCKILSYELSFLPGTFSHWKPDGTEFLVRNLETPAGVQMNAALLRTPDILAIQFDERIST